jgi:hypothetical protein
MFTLGLSNPFSFTSNTDILNTPKKSECMRSLSSFRVSFVFACCFSINGWSSWGNEWLNRNNYAVKWTRDSRRKINAPNLPIICRECNKWIFNLSASTVYSDFGCVYSIFKLKGLPALFRFFSCYISIFKFRGLPMSFNLLVACKSILI